MIGDIPLKKKLFHDYPFQIKYLGAWGGDFMMATGRTKRKVEEYFNAKGLHEIYSYDEFIL